MSSTPAVVVERIGVIPIVGRDPNQPEERSEGTIQSFSALLKSFQAETNGFQSLPEHLTGSYFSSGGIADEELRPHRDQRPEIPSDADLNASNSQNSRAPARNIEHRRSLSKHLASSPREGANPKIPTDIFAQRLKNAKSPSEHSLPLHPSKMRAPSEPAVADQGLNDKGIAVIWQVPQQPSYCLGQTISSARSQPLSIARGLHAVSEGDSQSESRQVPVKTTPTDMHLVEAPQNSSQTRILEPSPSKIAKSQPDIRAGDQQVREAAPGPIGAPVNSNEKKGFRTNTPELAHPGSALPHPETIENKPAIPASNLTAHRGQSADTVIPNVPTHAKQSRDPFLSKPEASIHSEVREVIVSPDANPVPHTLTGNTVSQTSHAAVSTKQDTFALLDQEQGSPAVRWTHAGPQRAEAGFHDPSIGWIGVRAQTNSSGLHASLVPATSAAAQVLNGHLAALNEHLANAHANVQVVTMSAPNETFASSELSGGAPGDHQGHTRREAPEERTDGRESAPPRSASLSNATKEDLDSRVPSLLSIFSGGMHISVVA